MPTDTERLATGAAILRESYRLARGTRTSEAALETIGGVLTATYPPEELAYAVPDMAVVCTRALNVASRLSGLSVPELIFLALEQPETPPERA